MFLFKRDLKARVEPDGSSSWVYSATAKKLLFGRETTEVFKIQSGVKIGVKPQDDLGEGDSRRRLLRAQG